MGIVFLGLFSRKFISILDINFRYKVSTLYVRKNFFFELVLLTKRMKQLPNKTTYEPLF